MTSKKKAEAIGRVLILSRELDTVRGDNLALQKILGKKIYYQKSGKWYYDINKMDQKTTKGLEKISKKITSTIK